MFRKFFVAFMAVGLLAASGCLATNKRKIEGVVVTMKPMNGDMVRLTFEGGTVFEAINTHEPIFIGQNQTIYYQFYNNNRDRYPRITKVKLRPKPKKEQEDVDPLLED